MGSKIWCQVGEFEFHFQNSYGEMCFWKIMLKVRSFKSTGDHRPFLSNFDVKLGSWGMIHTGDHRFFESFWTCEVAPLYNMSFYFSKMLHQPPTIKWLEISTLFFSVGSCQAACFRQTIKPEIYFVFCECVYILPVQLERYTESQAIAPLISLNCTLR